MANGMPTWRSPPPTPLPGNLIDIQYSALYSVTNGPMRLSVLFFDVNSNVVRRNRL